MGCKREVRFTGTPTLTHSANLILPYSANITTVAGEIFTFRCTASGVWILVNRVRGDLGFTPINKAGDIVGGAIQFTATPSFYVGTVGTQQGLFGMGWNNGISRYAAVMEADARLALYSYDAAGASPRQIANFVNANGNATLTGNLTVTGGPIEAKRSGGLPSSVVAYDGNGTLGVVMSQGFNTNTDLIGYLFNRANADLNFGTNNTARMCITAAGRIQLGIGSFGISSVQVSSSAPGALADGTVYFQTA